MADITRDFGKGDSFGSPRIVGAFPMAAAKSAYGRCMVNVDSSGYAHGLSSDATVGVSFCPGVAARGVDNSSGAAAAAYVDVEDLAYLDNDSTNPVTQAMLGRQLCYQVDNHTVGASDVGGTLLAAGVPLFINAATSRVAVSFNAALVQAVMGAPSGFRARGVATNLAAGAFSAGVYTATANAAVGTQDGLTLAVNDVIMLLPGTIGSLTVSAANSGPYVVTALGATDAKTVLTRPSWWKHGDQIPAGRVVQIFGGGTLFGGCAVKAICDKGLVIGTGDPGLLPDKVSQAVTFSSGSSGAITNVPLRASGKSDIVVSNTGTAAHASTRVWRVASYTLGPLGTASFTVNAESAPGTTNTSDVGVYTISVISW